MKLLKKLICVFTLLAIFSCQKETEEELIIGDIDFSPSVILNETSRNNLKKIILNADFSIKYPVKLLNSLKDSEKLTSDSFLNNKEFLKHLNDSNNLNAVTAIVYPVTFTKKDKTTIVLNNNEELENEVGANINFKSEDFLTSETISKINLLKDSKSTFSYPFDFVVPVKIPWSNLVFSSKTINNKEELTEFLNNRNKDNKSFAIAYPINATNNLKEKNVINNNAELDIYLKATIDTSVEKNQ